MDEPFGVSGLFSTEPFDDAVKVVSALVGDFREVVAYFLNDGIR
jgi:hypothetical protein